MDKKSHENKKGTATWGQEVLTHLPLPQDRLQQPVVSTESKYCYCYGLGYRTVKLAQR